MAVSSSISHLKRKFVDLIYGLMDWLDVTDGPEPAIATLRLVLDRHYPNDGCASARCRFLDESGVDRIFHAGYPNLKRTVIAQRAAWRANHVIIDERSSNGLRSSSS